MMGSAQFRIHDTQRFLLTCSSFLPLTGSIQSPTALLSLSARGLESYAAKLLPAEASAKEQWAKLFTASSAELAEAGMSVQERRYTLWLLQKYRQGADPAKAAHPAPPKKKVR